MPKHEDQQLCKILLFEKANFIDALAVEILMFSDT